MTKKELLIILTALQNSGDTEINHGQADKALIEFINDKKITEAFDKIKKWYS